MTESNSFKENFNYQRFIQDSIFIIETENELKIQKTSLKRTIRKS